MGAGITFRVGGQLDPSYRAAMSQSVAEAKAANIAINEANAASSSTAFSLEQKAFLTSKARSITEQAAIRKQIADLKVLQAAMVAKSPLASSDKVNVAKEIASKTREIELLAVNQAALEVAKIKNDAGIKLSAAEANRLRVSRDQYVSIVKKQQDEEIAGEKIKEMEKVAAAAKSAAARKVMDAETTAALIRDSTGAMEWAQIEDEARTAAAAKQAAERVAIEKAEQLKKISIIARGHGAGVAMGHEGGGSVAGVVSEVAVIGHETLQGRGTGRIIGSISILGQRLGWLRKIVKTTADESVDAAEASKKIGMTMAANAIQAEKLAAAKIADGIASGLDQAASEQLAVAEIQVAATTRAEALAHEKNTVALVEEAAMKQANASITSVLGVKSKVMGGLLVALVVSLVACIYYYNRLRVVARELATSMASAPAFNKQIEAFEKGADEARKMAEALAHLAAKQETLATKSDEAVDAIKRHADAVGELDDAVKNAALSQIDLNESTGKITAVEAVALRAKVERDAVIMQAAKKQNTLDTEAKQRRDDAANAKVEEAKAIEASKAAQDKLTGGRLSKKSQDKVSDLISRESNLADPMQNIIPRYEIEFEKRDREDKIEQDKNSIALERAGQSPEEKIAYESQSKQAKLAQVKADEDELKKKLDVATKARDDRNNTFYKPGANNLTNTGWTGTEQSVNEAQRALKAKSIEKEKLLDSMSETEIAASDAKAKADQAHASAIKLGTDATKATTAAEEAAAVAPKITAEQLAVLENKETETKNKAVREQADAKMQADLAVLDLREKSGQTTSYQANRERAQIEKAAAQREHPDMVASPDNVLGQKFREIDARHRAEELGTPQAHRTGTERERVGIGAPQVANLQKQTLAVSKSQLSEMQKLNANVTKLIKAGGGSDNPDGW